MNDSWKKKIVLFLSSQTISLFGSMLVQYAISWYVTLKTQSGMMMTVMIICGFLPTFFLSPFAGVWADRYNRKILIVLSDSVIALSTLVLAILFMMGYEPLWLIFVITAIRALGGGVQAPAVNAYIPQIVPEDKLTKVNATNGTIQSLTMLVCPMLSGLLLSLTGIQVILLIDVVTAAIAVTILLVFLHVPSHKSEQDHKPKGYVHDMLEGITYIKNHPFIKQVFVFCAIYFFMVSPVAFLTPLQVARIFGSDVWRLTAMEIFFSGGMIAGGIIMTVWGGFKNKTHTMVLAVFILGLCTFALGVAPLFWFYLILMAVSGISMPFFNTPFTVLLQQKIEPDYLGRVFGVFSMISSSMMPFGMLLFGPLADMKGVTIGWLLIGTGFVIAIQAITMLKSKVLIEAGKPVEEEV